ncbi:hypothetical protein [Frankia sp. ArI3]|uniref:hypothetical protein n=1 Tax=Frankia sp. ArI3 TaxID=1858 RepID=UPI00210806DB|nr:hypothetical protein [Frankia sp. ArI3]
MLIIGRPALVISEFQRGIVDPAVSRLPALAEQAESRGVGARIGALAEAFRAAGLPVVHAIIEHRPDLVGLRANSALSAMAIKRRTMIAGSVDVEVPEPVTPARATWSAVAQRDSPRSTAPTSTRCCD